MAENQWNGQNPYHSRWHWDTNSTKWLFKLDKRWILHDFRRKSRMATSYSKPIDKPFRRSFPWKVFYRIYCLSPRQLDRKANGTFIKLILYVYIDRFIILYQVINFLGLTNLRTFELMELTYLLLVFQIKNVWSTSSVERTRVLVLPSYQKTYEK